MKEIQKFIIVLTFAFTLFIVACGPVEDPREMYIREPSHSIGYSPEEIAFLDSMPSVTYQLEEIVLPNGLRLVDFMQEVDSAFMAQWAGKRLDLNQTLDALGSVDARNYFIGKLTTIAHNLVDRSRHAYPAEGPNSPAQDGLAYVWGGKDHTIRRAGVLSEDGTCRERLYGLDCSGMLYQMFNHAGVKFIEGNANMQREPARIQRAITEALPDFDKIMVEDLGKIAPENFETGDIIYWERADGTANHIGMVLKTEDGSLAVYQSNGAPGQCLKNQGPHRGPRTLPLNDGHWFKPNRKWGVVRISVDISGKWNFYMRCNGQMTDVFERELEFPTGASNVFSLESTATDYDGSEINLSFVFEYDREKTRLSSELIVTEVGLPDFERKDGFSYQLLRDDSGYIPAENHYINGGTGCAIEVRLVNLE